MEGTGLDPMSGLQWLDSEDQGMRQKRKRTARQDITPQFMNQMEAEARLAFQFVALVDVAPLDPFWGYGLAANRALIKPHVTTLIDTFSQKGIRRFNADTRLRVAILGQIINHILEDMLEDMRVSALTFSAITLMDYPVVNLSLYAGPGIQFRLKAGQHC
ncbi:hypothetical protein DTO169C6_9256 [Paecilomyces variotii]|nr:hypothetical protein DTO169C6_9256 [Paecilomyces variotii]